jgi:hypothetical protein
LPLWLRQFPFSQKRSWLALRRAGLSLNDRFRSGRDHAIKPHIPNIVSCGQTGADRATLDWALSLGIECGGWCPKWRKAEDGRIAAKYPLTEIPSANYEQRTE